MFRASFLDLLAQSVLNPIVRLHFPHVTCSGRVSWIGITIPQISSKFQILLLLNFKHTLHLTLHNMSAVTQNKLLKLMKI
jgi:hypothetical protein